MSDNSVFLIVMLLVSGVALTGFSGYVWFDQRQEVRTFEPTEATVISSDVHGMGEDRELDVTYEYTVDGETYESSNVYPGAFDLNSNAEAVVADHPEGATVTAYYDPANPSNAFLIKTRNTLILLLMTAFGLLLTVIGGGMVGARFGLVSS
jgi:hypothetical protein